ncbi:helix-turn-helix domain-containing protein [Streptomyces sp. NPDC001406]
MRIQAAELFAEQVKPSEVARRLRVSLSALWQTGSCSGGSG